MEYLQRSKYKPLRNTKKCRWGNFTTIGQATASAAGTYHFTDDKPHTSTNYYRLKIVDKDGSIEYSSIRIIKNDVSFDVTLYPNPVKDVLLLRIFNQRELNMKLQILSADAKVVMSTNRSIAEGTSVQQLDVSSLISGTYFVKMTSGTEVMVLEFNKIK